MLLHEVNILDYICIYLLFITEVSTFINSLSILGFKDYKGSLRRWQLVFQSVQVSLAFGSLTWKSSPINVQCESGISPSGRDDEHLKDPIREYKDSIKQHCQNAILINFKELNYIIASTNASEASQQNVLAYFILCHNSWTQYNNSRIEKRFLSTYMGELQQCSSCTRKSFFFFFL